MSPPTIAALAAEGGEARTAGFRRHGESSRSPARPRSRYSDSRDTCSSVATTTRATTTSDLYDTGMRSRSHREDLTRIRRSSDRARRLDAQERARRFEAARPDCCPETRSGTCRSAPSICPNRGPSMDTAPMRSASSARRLRGASSSTAGRFLVSYDATLDPVTNLWRGCSAPQFRSAPASASSTTSRSSTTKDMDAALSCRTTSLD